MAEKSTSQLWGKQLKQLPMRAQDTVDWHDKVVNILGGHQGNLELGMSTNDQPSVTKKWPSSK